ncbi:hypothetical protein [Aurantimonas sp. 22II-16-19i]|uniref:hypothetical protein n=1 Tax=Aurantimonas sp. 22II-16-19i TaxID=1317114 RepID=UPI0009F7C1AE|nr:hypothetical protein [Aurantimonas sp. 22II-16-19i]ORE90956.1 hypothetical protein ATO4_19879 [Aurantimonas sp. 22II-16-19i]
MKMFLVAATVTTHSEAGTQAIAEDVWAIVAEALREHGYTPGLVQATGVDLPEQPDHTLTEITPHG